MCTKRFNKEDLKAASLQQVYYDDELMTKKNKKRYERKRDRPVWFL